MVKCLSDPNSEGTTDPEVKDTRISDEDIEKISQKIKEKLPDTPAPRANPQTDPPLDPIQQQIAQLTESNAQLVEERRQDYLGRLSTENQAKFKDANLEILKAVSSVVPVETAPTGLPLVPQGGPQSPIDSSEGTIGGYDLKTKTWKKQTL